ncbi:MAG TPA: MFS transporter [Spirochaetota bacterium]|nr:MFS transporter [Spirochaetota bacterium]
MKNIKNIIISSILVLVIAQSLNFILGISSFENFYRTLLVAKYKIINKEMRRQIETGINFGKPLYKFSGMESIFSKTKIQDSEIEKIFITNTSGLVLYSLEEKMVGKNADVEQIKFSIKDIDASETFSEKNLVYTILPIFENDGSTKKWIGNTYLAFNEMIIRNAINKIINDNIKKFILSLLIAIVILVFLIVIITMNHESNFSNKKKFALKNKHFVIIVLVLVSSQLIFSFINNKYYEKAYLRMMDINLKSFSSILSKNIEFYTNLGLKITKLKKAEDLLANRLKDVPECQEIIITDIDGKVLYKANNNQKESILEENSTLKNSDVKLNLSDTELKQVVEIKNNDKVLGHIVFLINKKLIDSKLLELLMDALTVIAVSLIFSFEILVLFSFFVEKKKEQELLDESSVEEVNIKLIRLTSFIFFFTELIPLSFMPIYIKNLYTANPVKFFGLAYDTILSIPFSSYMFGITIFILIIGFLSKKISVRNIFFLSILFLILGSLLSALATDIIQLTIFRFISGLGYGGCLINGTSLVMEKTKSTNRATGFGYWSLGYATSSICAISIGGIIANRLGFRVGMLVSTVFALMFLIYVFTYIKEPKNKKELIEDKQKEKIKFSEILSLFRNKSILASLLFSNFPIQIIFFGIFQYALPLYMNDKGISQSNIGRILTIFGLMALFTPVIASLADKMRNDRIFIIVGNLITGFFLILFFIFNSFYMLIISIISLSIGVMFVDSVEESYITSSKEAKIIGEAKLLSVYKTLEKMMAVISPLIAGILITTFNYSKTIMIIGIMTLVSVVFFVIFSKNLRE